MPLCDKPDDVEQQRVQSLECVGDGGAGRAGRIQDAQDVWRGGAVGVAEVPSASASPARTVSHPRVDRQQHLVGVGGGLPDALPLAAHALGERGQHAR